MVLAFVSARNPKKVLGDDVSTALMIDGDGKCRGRVEGGLTV